jgi:aquaporin Z
MEAAEIGLFMLAACAFSVLLFSPASPVAAALPSPLGRRLLMGLAMGGTAVALIHSPMGKRSGAHMNPSVTLTYLRLDRVAPRDAVAYVAAQFAGAIAGVMLAAALLGDLVAHPAVAHAATVPGPLGVGAAFAAEVLISFVLMIVILHTTNAPRWSRYTGWCAGLLIALYITLEAPISGMSMNPARTLGSAIPAHAWTAIWIYFAAPLLGMLLGAEVFVRRRGLAAVFCAKLDHHTASRCIFCTHRERHHG